MIPLNLGDGNDETVGDGTIAIEVYERAGDAGRTEVRFALSRYYPDGQGGHERAPQFEPADLPRLLCVVQTLCGFFAASDELDEATARQLHCVHNILAEFMRYSLERLEADDGAYFARLQSHSTRQ